MKRDRKASEYRMRQMQVLVYRALVSCLDEQMDEYIASLLEAISEAMHFRRCSHEGVEVYQRWVRAEQAYERSADTLITGTTSHRG